MKSPPITGRCYCGQHRLCASTLPQTTAYCHCDDCRRITGGPVAAFSAFALNTLGIFPDPGPSMSVNAGVTRWFCRNCGSALAAHYDYLPDQLYVPIGMIDQASDIKPEMHCYAESGLPWLHIQDDLERHLDSGSDTLNKSVK